MVLDDGVGLFSSLRVFFSPVASSPFISGLIFSGVTELAVRKLLLV